MISRTGRISMTLPVHPLMNRGVSMKTFTAHLMRSGTPPRTLPISLMDLYGMALCILIHSSMSSIAPSSLRSNRIFLVSSSKLWRRRILALQPRTSDLESRSLPCTVRSVNTRAAFSLSLSVPSPLTTRYLGLRIIGCSVSQMPCTGIE